MKILHAAIVLFLVFPFLGFPDICSAEEAGLVLTVKRDVYLIRGGQKESAKPRSPLRRKDAVETAATSRTKLFFNDDSILNLGEMSQVVVEEYLRSGEEERTKSIYKLVEGSLKVVVGKSELEIHTPTAVAAARGTKFIMWVEGTGPTATTGILVLEGEVLFKNIRSAVKGIERIRKGQMSRIPSSKPPTPPTPASQAVRAQYDQDTLAIGSVFEKGRDRLPSPTTFLQARAVQENINVLQTPPIVQEPLGLHGGENLSIRVEW